MRHAKRRGRALPFALVVVLLVLLAPAALANPEATRLQETRAELAEVREQLDEARAQRDDEAEALAVAEERVEDVLRAVTEAELAVERQEIAVDDAENELRALIGDAEQQRQATGERVARIYMQNGDDSVQALLTGTSVSEVIGRSTILGVLARSDRESFEALGASAVAISAQADRLEEERAALERVKEEQRALLAEVEELREDQAMALAEAEAGVEELHDHAAYLASEEREIAQAARRAAEEAEQAEQAESRRVAERADRSAAADDGGSGGGGNGEATSGGGDDPPPASSGSWAWPASGTVTSEYGPRWGRLHAGIDIAAGHGSPITAARAGTVSSAGWQGGYGNTVMVSHGGGVVTLYAHLSSISVSPGQSVSQGQRLGGMGCTGSCTGTHLHFEVRVNGAAQNPRGFLR